MDDLRKIRELYGEPEERPGARNRVRARIEAEHARRRRPRWTPLLAGLAVAAVAAVAFAVPRLPVESPADDKASVLLAAAGVAEEAPATKGAYWHVKRKINGSGVRELWVARDGRAWTTERRGTSTVTAPTREPFTMDGHPMTIAEIEALPDDPATLRAHVNGLLRDVPERHRGGVVADALSGLLWSKPAPPAVRAAAYRALAELPDVRYLGGSTFAYDVRGVRRELVIDTESQVVKATTGATTEVVLEAEWTDEKQ
ncbi:hypothetical protein ACFXJ8_25685 [Nonomuraea sp. NPDC059194]|uniref:hypothetical protein n=1 Tax=Nonomuraea sp. NPDC059194 TaxID=3346764 RepID=UPI003676DCD8